ncbi:MAG TPA: TM2 domain-containing protein [Verrucomicrobiae bacterium]|nr:TM2 domain-containing protein [Verrucomicrobiae bacterium]
MTPYAQMIGSHLPPQAQATYAYEYRRYAKDPGVALMLTIFLGIVGGESYYIGDWKRGILMSIALFTGIGVLVTIPMWIVRCFTISGECDAHNDYLAYLLAYRYWPQGQFGAVPEPPVSPTQTAPQPRPNISGLPMQVRSN